MRVLKKKWNLTCCLGNILMKKRNFTNDDWQGNHLKDSLVVVVATKCYWQEVIKTTQFSLEFSFFFGKVDSFLSPIGLSMHVGDPFFTNTACVHTYPAYFPAVSGNFWKRSPEWNFFIRYEYAYVWTVVSANLRIRLRHFLESSLHVEHYKQTWRTARLYLLC